MWLTFFPKRLPCTEEIQVLFIKTMKDLIGISEISSITGVEQKHESEIDLTIPFTVPPWYLAPLHSAPWPPPTMAQVG
jgi:hypothetical protein